MKQGAEMYLNKIGTGIINSTRKAGRLATLAVGLASCASGCATHAAQTVQMAKADRFTPDINHILQNLDILRQSDMLTSVQLGSLLKIPSSNPAELVQATTDAVMALKACQIADAQCAENARPVCQEFKENIFECPEYKTRCDGILQNCAKFVNKYIIAVTNLLRSEATEVAKNTPR